MKSGNKILFVLCAIALAIGVGIYLEASAFQKTAKIAQGTVTSSSMSHFEIQYTADDGTERIYKRAQNKKRRHHDGDIIKVFYKIDNPVEVRITDGIKTGKKIVFYTSLLLLFNIYSAYQGRKKEKSDNYFRATGRKVEAQVLKIDKDMSLAIKGKNPYSIDCSWVDPITGKEYAHTIRNVWNDPEIMMAGRRSIDVYIDRNDPEKYFMDISFLGEAAM
jgi:uncharacterized protein (UPF0333 family)